MSLITCFVTLFNPIKCSLFKTAKEMMIFSRLIITSSNTLSRYTFVYVSRHKTKPND